jgi:hypothetical protein
MARFASYLTEVEMSSEKETMDACSCETALQHSFTSSGKAVMGVKFDAVIATSDMLGRNEAKWMSIYRCRVCGRLWVEGCHDRGQVYFYYLFPAPQIDDPVRWLNEEAEELPSR